MPVQHLYLTQTIPALVNKRKWENKLRVNEGIIMCLREYLKIWYVATISAIALKRAKNEDI